MPADRTCRIAILFPGDGHARQTATPASTRFATIFQQFADHGVDAECAVYHDDFCADVRAQLLGMDAVLVWMNPIVDHRDRSILDAMLRDVAARGVFVSTHPDVILKLGTKQVLFDTRALGWGTDVDLYPSLAALEAALPARLHSGQIRVLKQYRGHSGDGVWKIEMAQQDARRARSGSQLELPVRVRHAKRGCEEEVLPLSAFLDRCEPYFRGDGRMIDQAYQPRLPEGMIRCYLVQSKVQGFGHQAVNALCPAPSGMPATAAPQPGPRLYHPPTDPRFQTLKQTLEDHWLPAAQRLLGIESAHLPILWDCDFLLGPRDAAGGDTFVLCEINVSSVAPYPDSVVAPVVTATLEQIAARRT